jgi:hypothetical protein
VSLQFRCSHAHKETKSTLQPELDSLKELKNMI